MRRIAVVDYGLCNLDSIRRAIEICGGKPAVCRDGKGLRQADMIVLPGVGAFDVAMKALDASDMSVVLKEQAGRGVPLLGICLGMQLLGSTSQEGQNANGLDLISGDVVLLERSGNEERVPHMGWNTVQAPENSRMFAGIADEHFYFEIGRAHV